MGSSESESVKEYQGECTHVLKSGNGIRCTLEYGHGVVTGHPHMPEREFDHYDDTCGMYWMADVSAEMGARPEREGREGDTQSMPTPNGEQSTQSWLKDWLSAREDLGRRRYGTGLQPFNGRDSLLDALEEAGDLFTYLANEYREQQARLADHDHEDCNAAVRYVNEVTPYTDNRYEYATNFLRGLAERGYILIKKEHA